MYKDIDILTKKVISGALSTGQRNYFKKFADDERTSHT